MEEARVVALLVAAMRHGIAKDAIADFVEDDLGIRDVAVRNRCFLRALDINAEMDKKFGHGQGSMALVVETVKAAFLAADEEPLPTATVVKRYTRSSPIEASLDRIGQTVAVVDQQGAWVYVEVPDGAGWVPRDSLSFNLDI